MQNRFWNNSSCDDAIAAVTESFRTGIEKTAEAQAGFFDLQISFDTLDHDQ